MGHNKYNKKYNNNVSNESQEQLEEQVVGEEIQEGENLVEGQEQGVIVTEGSEGQEVADNNKETENTEGSEDEKDSGLLDDNLVEIEGLKYTPEQVEELRSGAIAYFKTREDIVYERMKYFEEKGENALLTQEDFDNIIAEKEAEAEAKRLADEEEAKRIEEEAELKKLSADKSEDKVDAKGVVGDILKSSASIKEKLKAISELDNGLAYKSIVNKLLSYNEKMFNEQAVKPKDGAAANYDLFNLIKQVVSDSDFNSFKVKFSIINLMFLGYDKEAFSEQKLHRFDYEWKWGKESLTTYQHLITMIAMLANRSTREHHISKGILNRALNKDVISLNETAIQNIIKYYQS